MPQVIRTAMRERLHLPPGDDEQRDPGWGTDYVRFTGLTGSSVSFT